MPPDDSSMKQPITAAAPVLERPGFMRRYRTPLMVVGPVVVIGAALFFFLTSGRYVGTDDAYARVASVQISANESGRVVEVDVKENQHVHAGDVLFRLEAAPYDIAINSAQANLADSKQKLAADVAGYRQAQVAVSDAQSAAVFRETERKREQGLLAAGAVSKSEYDQAARDADAAKLQVANAQHALAAALANLGGSPDLSVDAHPSVRSANAELAHARLQQFWSVIRAPQDGRVTHVEQLQVGDYINAAAPVFNLVTPRAWVEADFKENQLKHMRPGQPASVKIDAYPGYTFDAVVDSVAPGTDQTFSVLPAENSSGNWVKVVQRVPVRLAFTKPLPIELAGGLSARVKVDVKANPRNVEPAR